MSDPGPPPRRPASTATVTDQLMLLFGRVVAAMLLLVAAVMGLLAVVRPDADLSALANLLDTHLSLLIGALLGYAAHSPSSK